MSHKNFFKSLFSVGILLTTGEKNQEPDPNPDPDLDLFQNVTDLHHWH
jgi:hypothetical protein